MDDLILAARLFEKGYAPNLTGGGIRSRATEYGKNLFAGGMNAATTAIGQKLQPLTDFAESGQRLRNPGLPSEQQDLLAAKPKSITPTQAHTMNQIDPTQITGAAPPPTSGATVAPQAAAPATDTSGMAAMRDAQGEIAPQYAPPQDLAPEDTAKRTETTTQTLATTGVNAGKPISSETNVKDQTVADLDGDGDRDADDEAIAAQQSPDPNTIGPTSALPPSNSAGGPTTTQNAAGAKQVENAQNLANTGYGGIGANIATMGGAALLGGIQRWRGNRKLNALANAQPGAGGATNANMIRADGTEFLDDYWELQKSRMDVRARGTTEAVRNAYR